MLTGRELKTARLRAGISQQQLADRIGLHRLTVGYWETKKGRFSATHGTPLTIAQSLGMNCISGSIRAGAAWGLTDDDRMRLESDLLRQKCKSSQHQSNRRVICAAQTRKGTLCKALSEPGKRRCKLHGGLSTGPKTSEGRARIAKAQRQRWAKLKSSKSVSLEI